MKNRRTPFLLVIAGLLFGLVLGLSLNSHRQGEIQITSTTRTISDVPEEITLLVNINTASAEQLSALPGIGEGFASSIIEYREVNGPFQAVEELLLVSGIGHSRLEAILDYVTVGGAG